MARATGTVVVVGASGHALVAIETLRSTGWDVVGCVSADPGSGPAVVGRLGIEVLGDDNALAGLVGSVDAVFVAIGDNRRRRDVTDRVTTDGWSLAHAVSPQAVISPSATVGAGALICAGAVVNALASIGVGAVVNTAATVEHECTVGAFSHLGPRSVLAGNVAVGDGALVGVGASVVPGVRLGAWCRVGAGAAVVADVADGVTVVGVPARPSTSR